MENFEFSFEPELLKDQTKYKLFKCHQCEKIPYYENCECCSDIDCENIFCKSCIKYFKKIEDGEEGNQCPSCKLKYISRRINKNKISELKNLEVYCRFDGSHVEIMENIIEHENICPSRLKNCQYCLKKFHFDELKFHEDRCDEMVLACPNCPFEGKTRKIPHDCNSIHFIENYLANREKIFSKKLKYLYRKYKKLNVNFHRLKDSINHKENFLNKKRRRINTLKIYRKQNNKMLNYFSFNNVSDNNISSGSKVSIKKVFTHQLRKRLTAITIINEDKKIIILGEDDGEILVCSYNENMTKLNFLHQTKAHLNKIVCLRSLYQNDKFVSSGLNCSIKIWKYDETSNLSLNCLFELNCNMSCNYMMLNPFNSNELIYCQEKNGDVNAVDLSDYSQIMLFKVPNVVSISAIEIVQEYESKIDCWVLGNSNGEIFFFKNFNLEKKDSESHNYKIVSLLHLRENIVCSCSSDGKLVFWDIVKINIVQVNNFNDNITRVFFMTHKYLGFFTFRKLGVIELSESFTQNSIVAHHNVLKLKKGNVIMDYLKKTGDIFFFKENIDNFQYYKIQGLN
jgi:hypothetical protein